MLKEGIIEPSQSPWRAHTLVISPENHQKRLVDYSQNINWFTLLDAYPLPRIEDMVNEIASYQVFNTLDIASDYHQVAVKPEEQKYTAFEAAGSLPILPNPIRSDQWSSKLSTGYGRHHQARRPQWNLCLYQ